ncbi:MAG: hypothetical protein ACI4ON_01945 [Clostridia bacterium]
MWLITALLVILIFLLLVVIMDTSMKLALMITTLYNYDTKKLFIPAALTVILWALLLFGCFNSLNANLNNNAIDILFAMVFDRTLIEGYQGILIKTLLSTFLIGTLLQSFTYYTVNINYQKITGTVRFSIKKLIKKIYLKIFKKDLYEKRVNSALSEVQRGPKKLTFIRAIITSVISMLITLAVCYGLFMIGTLLSSKVITMF